ncbi:MAG: Cof-type HAD-IIB family hydrolase [Oscillospiraceae bacterium]|nr:Cof-type HAD-IIB family hydrolase [Oscillospiraceae bacterium]
MNIRLIAFDLDGTLLDDQKKIPEDNIAALRAAASEGILIVPASGRIYPFMPEPVRTVLSARYFITTNGGSVYDAVNDEILYSAQIPLDQAIHVLDHMDSLDVLYDCYADDKRYTCASFAERADDYFTGPLMNYMLHTYILRTMQRTDDLRGFIIERGGPLQKMQMYFSDPDERLRQLQILPRLFPDLAISTSLPNNIEINSAEATKGQALSALCDRLRIDRSEVIVFGDGLNDLDMLQFAGLPVAMGNADPLIKEHSAFITCSNNDAGIAKALRHFKII